MFWIFLKIWKLDPDFVVFLENRLVKKIANFFQVSQYFFSNFMILCAIHIVFHTYKIFRWLSTLHWSIITSKISTTCYESWENFNRTGRFQRPTKAAITRRLSRSNRSFGRCHERKYAYVLHRRKEHSGETWSN